MTEKGIPQALVQELTQAVGGEVRTDRLTRQLYSTDASDFYKVPVGVVIPRDVDDVCAVMEIAARHGVAIIPRGAGSSLSGQTVGTGLVLDHAKYLSRKHFVSLQELQTEREHIAIEWGRLQLEESTLATHSKVENTARGRLGMRLPHIDEIVVIRR